MYPSNLEVGKTNDEVRPAREIFSDGYFFQALGNMGLGNEKDAKKLLEESLKIYRNHLWANVMMGISGNRTNDP